MPAGPAGRRGGAAEGQLTVAVDATPLIGRPTGVGQFARGVLGGLGARPDVAVTAFAVSWRRRRAIGSTLPAGVVARQRAMPARPLQRAWRHGDLPPLEWFVGPVDVVHGTNFVVPPTRRAVRVVSVHDLTTVRFPELCDGPTLAYPHLIRRAVAGGAWVHTPSGYVTQEVIEAFGAHPERVRCVPYGVPSLPAPEAGAVARLVGSADARYVLAIGTAEPRKDLPGLVRAFDRLGAERPDLRLVLAGPAGWGSDRLSEAIATSPLADRIVPTGWLDDASLSGLLHGAAVLAYPSIYEGFGFPPLQAMAAGVPVVATRSGSLPEVLADAAAWVEVGDVDGLAAALAEVLDSSEVRHRLVTAGALRVRQFGWERCASGLHQLYLEATAARPRQRVR